MLFWIPGVCRCAAGYSGLSCDVSAEDTVPTMIIQPAGTGSCGCDRRTTDDCNTVTVYGDNFVESTTLTCHYEFTQVKIVHTLLCMQRCI